MLYPPKTYFSSMYAVEVTLTSPVPPVIPSTQVASCSDWAVWIASKPGILPKFQ